MNLNTICLVIAAVLFAVGAFPEQAGSKINWQNAGLAFVTLAFILG